MVNPEILTEIYVKETKLIYLFIYLFLRPILTEVWQENKLFET